MEWKNAIPTKAKQKLDTFSSFHYNSVLSKPYVMEELSRLQRKYVFVPTDKANNNVSIICKKFYVQLIKNEVNSQTYNISSESVESIIDRHEVFLKEHGIKLISEKKHLPYLYYITKMHKDPIKFRYITSGAQSSLKQLSVTVGLILQRCLKIAKNHSAYHNRYYPRNDYYVIDSNSDVLQFMFNSNLYSGYKSLTTFDFSTVYTSIPHAQLKDNLNNFLNRIFDIKSKCFVICNLFSKCVYFSDSNSISKSCIKFTLESLLECLNYLIDNAYIILMGMYIGKQLGSLWELTLALMLPIYIFIAIYIFDSNSDVLQFMFNSNLYSGYKSLTTFDFSTMYTSIPHAQLKDNLNNFLNRIFDIKSKCFVVCNLFSKFVYFSDSNSISKSCIKFTLESLLECLNYLIDNAYIILMGMYIGKQLGSLWELTLALMLPIYIFINMKKIILIICILIT